jgi:hypothetical protein
MLCILNVSHVKFNVMGVNARENIVKVVAVDLTTNDYAPGGGFFIRSGVGGVIRYCPTGNTDAEAITKTIDASAVFNDCEYCRKIFRVGTTATEIYAGYGV